MMEKRLVRKWFCISLVLISVVANFILPIEAKDLATKVGMEKAKDLPINMYEYIYLHPTNKQQYYRIHTEAKAQNYNFEIRNYSSKAKPIFEWMDENGRVFYKQQIDPAKQNGNGAILINNTNCPLDILLPHKNYYIRISTVEAIDENVAISFYYRSIDGAGGGLVSSFVDRLYNLCLGRKADAKGKNYWMNRLLIGDNSFFYYSSKDTGATVVKGFFFSNEMNKMNLSNSEFIERCYKVMLNRNADASGKKHWLSLINKRLSKLAVVKGFVESNEFTAICKKYQIERGYIELSEKDQYHGIYAFVERLYQKVLGRSADEAGLQYWTRPIIRKVLMPKEVATRGFFESQEFKNKNLNNEQYIRVLYRTFLEREADASGLQYWLSKMNSGVDKKEILNGFADSKEFANLSEQYGLSEYNNIDRMKYPSIEGLDQNDWRIQLAMRYEAEKRPGQCTEIDRQFAADVGISRSGIPVVVPESEARFGDQCYYSNNGYNGATHVAFYLGSGMCLHGNYLGAAKIAPAYLAGASKPVFYRYSGN